MKTGSIKSKIEQATRLIMVNTITRVNESVLVVEYPKSGGTWLGQLVSGYLGIPFPRNRMPVPGRALFHGHYLPKGGIPGNKRILYLVRDGRDVMVSLYFHQLIWNEKNRLNPKDVMYHRAQTGFGDFEDVRGNMKDFIEYTFTSKPSKWQHFTYMGDWASYNDAWLTEMESGNTGIYMIRYEEMLRDTYAAMEQLLINHLVQEEIDSGRLHKIVDAFSFEKQARRKKGEEKKNSFLRKGIAGDWKNYFGPEEKEAFRHYTGDLLVRLGYEKDTNW